MLRTRIFFAFLFFVAPFLAVGQAEIPELANRRVHDEAGILSASTVSVLEETLRRFEDSTSNQMAILIIRSLDGAILEEYALKVAHEKWKLGQEKKDNGILLLVSVNDHKMRIDVGQGLEGALTDALCNRIIRNEIAPRFRNNDFDAGVIAGVDAVMMATKGEYTSDSSDVRNNRRGRGRSTSWWIIVLILLIVLSNFRRRGPGSHSGWSGGGGWFIGGVGGGSGGGSSWGGGGFSGGGGSFGGGGSSGSW